MVLEEEVEDRLLERARLLLIFEPEVRRNVAELAVVLDGDAPAVACVASGVMGCLFGRRGGYDKGDARA